MARKAVPAQRTPRRNALVLAGFIVVGLVVAAFIVAGPMPSERHAAAIASSGGATEASAGVAPQAHDHDDVLVSAVSSLAPQAPIAPAAPPIQLLGADAWDAVSAANVAHAMAVLPASVQAQLGNPLLGPISILVNFEGRTSSGYQPYGQAANFFSTNEGHNEVVLYPQQSAFTIVHELGHAYNLRNSPAGNYAWVLLEPEMQSFMAAAGWQVLTPADQIARMYDHAQVAFNYAGTPIWSSLSHDDPLEDFANSFADYFVDPGDLASRSPERFAWFAARFP